MYHSQDAHLALALKFRGERDNSEKDFEDSAKLTVRSLELYPENEIALSVAADLLAQESSKIGDVQTRIKAIELKANA